MKKNLAYIFLLSILLFACKKEEKLAYSAPDNVYLHYLDKDGLQDTTTLTYSFAYKPSLAQDTIWVPVIIMGPRVSHTRQFVLSVVDSNTTAIKGTHYEPLKASYTLPADSGSIKVPVILKNTDDELTKKTVTLALCTAAGGDFSADLPLSLRSKKISFSNQLEKPSWWIYWQSALGDYGRIKHQLFLISSGTVDLVDMSKPNAFLEIPRTLYYIDNTRAFLKDPFTWVTRNPSKGYVLVKRADGTNDYDFYNQDAPTKKFYLKYYTQVNAYFFVDEKGNQIII